MTKIFFVPAIHISFALAAIGATPTTEDTNAAVRKAVSEYTHTVTIPADSDLSSIKFEGVRKVKAEERLTAYRVAYSYQGQPLASDEFGDRNFRFTVDFAPTELSPALREALAERKIGKAAEAAYFQVAPSPAAPSAYVTITVNALQK